MGKKLVYTSEGETRVVSLSAEAARDIRGAARRLGLLEVSYIVVDDANGPTAEFGLQAWRKRGSTVVLDMEAARAGHLAEIRRVRNDELRALDIDWMKAMDRGDSAGAAAIGRKRQALRETPQKFNMNSAGTADELAELWPDELADKKPKKPKKNGKG